MSNQGRNIAPYFVTQAINNAASAKAGVTVPATKEDRIAAMKASFARKQAEKASFERQVRYDHCLLDAIGCVAWGKGASSQNDGFYGEVEAHQSRNETESYMQVQGMEE